MGLVIEPRSYNDPGVQQLVAAVQAEYVVRYGGPDETHVEPGEFDPPHGLFVVGVLDGVSVATGGWRRFDVAGDGSAAEIKRMFVLDAARRRGIARLVLAELEATAAAADIDRIVLNTGVHQPEAIALYESSGYSPVPGYGYYAGYPNALFYGKSLRVGRAATRE